MRHLRALPVALIAFMIGVVISPIHFEVEGSGVGRMIDGGGGYSITTYSSSYFVRLAFAHSGHPSEEEANAVFDEHLAEAIEIIEITPKLGKNGRTIGRRAAAMFMDKETNKHVACVFWTQGKLIHSIHSTSLMHVLDFEKQNVVD